MPSFEGNLFTQWHQITSRETIETRLSYGEDPKSLSHLALNPYRVGTAVARENVSRWLQVIAYYAWKVVIK